ncbi:hypothetical protein AB0D83_08995 [Streptomyces decoyicus]|uniref:hypothetical protein n=1 Tax=Streptomyces decoyicus TaxID=249567 RepID=UPI0033ED1CEF
MNCRRCWSGTAGPGTPSWPATTGRTNVVAQALCTDPAALHHYLTHRLGALGALHTLETAPVLRTVKGAGPLAAPAAARRSASKRR